MDIYYLMIEAVPNRNNPESKEYGGAYVNCWVKAATYKDALDKAKEYIDEENWKFIKLEDTFMAQRQAYWDQPDSLECYDEADNNGLSAMFYTWPVDEN